LENIDGTTPFWRAAYAVDVDAMKLLVKYGADPNLPSVRNPANAAAGRGGAGGRGGVGGAAGAFGVAPPQPALDPAIDSASKAVPPGTGVYPVHAAAGVGYGNGFAGNAHRHAPDAWMPAMKYLVEELHADVNQRDNNGMTPLHHAASRGDNEMILYLVSKGADVKAVSRRGQTTVDLANGPVQRLRPFPETIALLEKLGAKNSHKCVSC
jgi:ankyrin repeat protein